MSGSSALKLVLDDASFKGNRVGEKISCSIDRSELISLDHGYAIHTLKGVVTSIFICFLDGYEGYRHYQGEILFENQSVNLDQHTTPSEVDVLIGDNFESWDDGVEKSNEYMINGKVLVVIWDSISGKLKHLSVEI